MSVTPPNQRAGNERRGGIVVLVYHRVLPEPVAAEGAGGGFAVTLGEFTRQMRWLREQGHSVMGLSEALERGGAGVVVTFDDGWSSTLRLALPVLLEHGLTATVFVTTDPAAEVFDEARAGDPPMTEAEWRELARAGMEIGSHGVTHRPLPGLGADEVRRELAESKRVIEAAIGKSVALFATPYGLSSSLVRRQAQRCGYRGLCPGRPGINSVPADPYAIRRMGVAPGMAPEAFARLAAGRLGPGTLAWKNLKWRVRQALGQRRAARVRSAARTLGRRGKSGSGIEA